MIIHHGLDNPDQVFFYEQDYYVLSNFSAFSISWDGMRFATVEHAYHYEKFSHNRTLQTQIWSAPSAHQAFKLAQLYKYDTRLGWDTDKVGVMRRLLGQKVREHSYVRAKLLATGERQLIENSWRDAYWGWGPNKDGMNMLGRLWMEIRNEIRLADIRSTKSQEN